MARSGGSHRDLRKMPRGGGAHPGRAAADGACRDPRTGRRAAAGRAGDKGLTESWSGGCPAAARSGLAAPVFASSRDFFSAARTEKKKRARHDGFCPGWSRRNPPAARAP